MYPIYVFVILPQFLVPKRDRKSACALNKPQSVHIACIFILIFLSIQQSNASLLTVQLLQLVETQTKTTLSGCMDFVQLEDLDCLAVKG